ncbi:conserved Plasmodium protein, unknown function [Plasmodium berghei]|uniref:RNA-binding protein, putative n=2 Tax=Plasmodium berghei TaxID=5821 RepID=A0A509AG28_PLABA|nr:RNA-binding protein, putative [Plasmodium berghei ANKA]CXH98946.1 conserved Plasmodium protein, unknown function [Plasmodium berghei]SCL91454.1 conserved Plasmodium protein, unknown function [Plasmodium berghei]SCM15473.1 conserved Plasmodium protein, unknown function [Plasmodium berghei]SCM17265.1 conserved Plasmodium protein, unknown function [Plasmodium berghei]SCN22418.1 conserved Plasmodium protein, unknown function [Plasmodium berghei]|eukprot:XP_034420071.1 RNA-binding protein, putative [Plasmodium berghei ANKA]
MKKYPLINHPPNQKSLKDQNQIGSGNNSNGKFRDTKQYNNIGNNNMNKMNMSKIHMNNSMYNNNNSRENNMSTINGNSVNSGNTMNSIKNNNNSLGLYIDNPQNAFIFDENDLKTLFSYYKGAKTIRILNDKAAAQITFNDPNMIQQVRKDINGLTINDIGTIRCIILNEGKVIEQFLPFSANDPANAHNKSNNGNQDNENTVNMLKKLANLLQNNGGKNHDDNNSGNINTGNSGGSSDISRANRNGGIVDNPQNGRNKNNENINNMFTKNQVKNKISNHSNYNNINPNFSQNNNIKNEHNDNPYATKRLSRFELIDIFGYPTEFDVMKKILGLNNCNISYVNENTNNKLSIEIKGKALNEAPIVERMHISVIGDDLVLYKKGIELLVQLLNSIFQEFCIFCNENNYQIPENLSFKRHEYMYKSDGSTKYVGFKDTWNAGKDNYINDYSFKKNKNLSKNEKEKRNHNSFGGYFN